MKRSECAEGERITIPSDLIQSLRKDVKSIVQTCEIDDNDRYGVSRLSVIDDGETSEGEAIDVDSLLKIEKYYLSRLDEVRRLNRIYHSATSIKCVIAFLNDVVRLVNVDPEIGFGEFCYRHMRHLRCAVGGSVDTGECPPEPKLSKGRKRIVGSVGMSFYAASLSCGFYVRQKSGVLSQWKDCCPRVTFTYEDQTNAQLVDLCQKTSDGEQAVNMIGQSLIVNVFDLCDAIKDGILSLFANSRLKKRELIDSLGDLIFVRLEEEGK